MLNEQQILQYVASLQAANPGYSYGITVGRVYVRVWRRFGKQDSRSVVAFINVATGMVHRANSWKQAGYVMHSVRPVAA